MCAAVTWNPGIHGVRHTVQACTER
jgi:hypothetical protein